MSSEDAAPRADAAGSQSGAAFFDLDRTLIAGASAFEFARAAYQAGMISRSQIARDAVANVQFRLQGATDEATEAVVERVGSMIQGRSVREMHRLAPSVLSGVLPRVYPRMMDVAYAHQDAGRKVYLCTAASNEIASLLADVLGFDGAIGTVSEVRDGVYTGKLDGPFVYGKGKAVAIRELADREGIDLTNSFSYSDSVSDLPMLEIVGNPVVVNPDAPLAAVAAERGWEVMRFEKLGQRLKLGVAILLAAVAGSAGSVVITRRRDRHKGWKQSAAFARATRQIDRAAALRNLHPPSGFAYRRR